MYTIGTLKKTECTFVLEVAFKVGPLLEHLTLMGKVFVSFSLGNVESNLH